MFFAFAIPALLEAAITAAAGTIAARVASDLYDKATDEDDDE
jgi:type IV secretory pathway VirB10-like protein